MHAAMRPASNPLRPHPQRAAPTAWPILEFPQITIPF